MPSIDKSLNINNVNFKVGTFDGDTVISGFAQIGVDVSGVYRVDDANVIHYVENTGGGGGGGATQLDELSDVSTAIQTAGFFIASSGADYEGRAIIPDDVPQLSATKIEFRGVKVTASGVDVTNELTDYDVNTFNEDFDTDGFFGVDSETITIPNDFGGYYDVVIDINPTIDSGSTPLMFFIDMLVNGIGYDQWVLDCFSLYPTRMTWTFKAAFLQSDDITFTVSKEGGTDGASDEVTVAVTLQFIGKAP